VSRLVAMTGIEGHHRRASAHALTVSELAIVLPALLKELETQGVELERLTSHEPTLEDVFVARTGRALRDA
jgi:hypothetical protein